MEMIHTKRYYYKGQWQTAIQLPINRAFRYGEGFFETILVKKSHIPLLKYHIDRVQKSLEYLGLAPQFNSEYIENAITSLSNPTEFATLRLFVWRKGGGLYAGSSNNWEALLEYEPIPHYEFFKQVKNIGISSYTNHYQPYGFIKSISSLHYTLIAHEKKNLQWDESLILSSQNHISECSASNIFWLIDQQIYTPSLKTACVAGSMRAYLIDFFKQKNLSIIECEHGLETLDKAQHIFSTNAKGITHWLKWKERVLTPFVPLMECAASLRLYN